MALNSKLIHKIFFYLDLQNIFSILSNFEFCFCSTGFPLAAVLCVPIYRGSQPLRMGEFNASTLEVVPCGINLESLMNTSSIEELPILSVLTSRPDELTEEELTIASNILASYLSTPEETVIGNRHAIRILLKSVFVCVGEGELETGTVFIRRYTYLVHIFILMKSQFIFNSLILITSF